MAQQPPQTNRPAPPNQNTNSPSASNSASSSAASSSSSVFIIPASAPAGIITITQPPQTATSYFKIAPSQEITFGWNFSYVLATPTHLTVSAICDNGNTYPVGPTDGIIPGTATQVVWDIFSYQQNNLNTPLAQATYTLQIFDERGAGSRILPGHLQPNSALKFALYTPQGYTGLGDGWTCAACSSATSLATQPAFIGVIASLLIMVLSGFQLLRGNNR